MFGTERVVSIVSLQIYDLSVKLIEEYWGGDDYDGNAEGEVEVTSDGQQFMFNPNAPQSGGGPFKF